MLETVLEITVTGSLQNRRYKPLVNCLDFGISIISPISKYLQFQIMQKVHIKPNVEGLEPLLGFY